MENISSVFSSANKQVSVSQCLSTPVYYVLQVKTEFGLNFLTKGYSRYPLSSSHK